MQDINNKIETSYGTVTIKKAGQGEPYRLYKKTFKRKAEKSLVKELNAIVRKYHPNYSDKEIENLYNELEKTGCTYASIANTIMKQLGDDDNLFRELFCYSLYDKDGNINYNKLAVDIFACIANMVELRVHIFERHVFDSKNFKSEVEGFLGKSFDNETDAIVALFKSGWNACGLDQNGNFIYESQRCINNSLIGNYREFAKELFGIDDPKMTKDKLEQLLNSKNIKYEFHFLNKAKKFSGSTPERIINYKKWLNKFFEVNNINLDVEVIEIENKTVPYEEFVHGIYSKINDGYTIEVGTDIGKPVWVTDGKKLGWTRPNSETAGHRMNFESFDEEGNILVCSWNEINMIPKEFYQNLNFFGLKIFNAKKDIITGKKSR